MQQLAKLPEGVDKVDHADLTLVNFVIDELCKLARLASDARAKVLKLGLDGYNVVMGGYMQIIQADDLMKLRSRSQAISRVFIDPYFQQWRAPALVVTLRSQRTMLELAPENARVPQEDQQVVQVSPLDLASIKDRMRLSLEQFSSFKQGAPIQDYNLLDAVLGTVENVHSDSFMPERPPHILCGFDDPRNSYFVSAFGFSQKVTIEDFGRVFAASPQRINLLGYDFQMKREQELGALVVELAADASSVTTAAFNIVAAPRNNKKRKEVVEAPPQRQKSSKGEEQS